MNALYQGFDANDDTSPLGVTISMQNTFELFCSELGSSCYQGHADCRFSASLYNDEMMLNRKTNGIQITMDRVAGVVFNQSMVEQSIGKCSYMFDGASFNRYNGAGGGAAATTDCEDPASAFGNVCPSTGKQCTVKDSEVTRCSCESMQEPSLSDVPQCYWQGAGFEHTDVRASADQTRKMVKARLRHQDGKDSNDRLEYWNEVVIDEHLLIEQLNRDPVPVIPAFIYVKGDAAGIDFARKMRDDYKQQFDVTADIPLIAVDTTKSANSVDGPFSFEEGRVTRLLEV